MLHIVACGKHLRKKLIDVIWQGGAPLSDCNLNRSVPLLQGYNLKFKAGQKLRSTSKTLQGDFNKRLIMKDIEWDQFFSVGIEEIDDDHRLLVNLCNMLNHSVKEGAGKDYVGAVLEELINCTVWHFSHEERLMLKHGYDKHEDHEAEHRSLIDDIKGLQQEFLQAGKLGVKDFEFLEYWLTQHILVADMRFGSFLTKVM